VKLRPPLVHDRQLAIYGGIAAYLIGTVLLWDAYERRGKDKPFALRFLP
jgi:hypothetical protein